MCRFCGGEGRDEKNALERDAREGGEQGLQGGDRRSHSLSLHSRGFRKETSWPRAPHTMDRTFRGPLLPSSSRRTSALVPRCVLRSLSLSLNMYLMSGEGMAALPVINHCVQHYPHFNVLMTTTTTSAFNVIKDQLPDRVIYQYAPLDVSTAVEAFLDFWSPDATILIENELWPNLILSASEKGIPLALLNARMSLRSFKLWSQQLVKPLVSLMLSKFSLIIPLGTNEAIRFQLLGAPPAVINFAGDLKYVVDVRVPTQDIINMEDLGPHFASRPVWMASSTHKGEEAVMSWIHKQLAQTHPGLLTIMVPRHPQRGKEIAKALREEGMNVKLRSQQKFISSSTEIYVVDTLGELKRLYRSTPIAVVGGSFFSGGSGHNVSEAAAARCAVLTGPHVGHFSQMIREMQRLDPLSVQQVSTKFELLDSLRELFSNAEALEARRMAAETTVSRLSRMVVQNIWNFIDIHVLRKGYS